MCNFGTKVPLWPKRWPARFEHRENWAPAISKSTTMSSKTIKLRPNQKASLRPAKGGRERGPTRPHADSGAHNTFGGANSQLLFSANPQPMYIYDPKTLAF